MFKSGVALLDSSKVFDKIGLSEGMRVADFGCGRTGHFVFPASGIVGNKGVVYALDVLKDVLESVKSRAKAEGVENVQTIWTDIEIVGATPIPENSLDVVFFANVMFALKSRNEAIMETNRLLKKDGYFVVVDWSKKLGPLGPTPEQMVNIDDLTNLAIKYNFKLVGNMPIGDYHFCVIFKKK